MAEVKPRRVQLPDGRAGSVVKFERPVLVERDQTGRPTNLKPGATSVSVDLDNGERAVITYEQYTEWRCNED